MILKALINVLFSLLKALFSWLNLPAMPVEITGVVDNIIGYIKSALPLLWVFFDKKLVTVCLVVAFACSNFDKIYDLLMWILAKLPLGINKN